MKGGTVRRGDVVALIGDVKNQKFMAGVLVTLEPPTKAMRGEAAEAGRYTSKLWHDGDYPKIQILTVEDLLSGMARIEFPPANNPFEKPEPGSSPSKSSLT